MLAKSDEGVCVGRSEMCSDLIVGVAIRLGRASDIEAVIEQHWGTEWGIGGRTKFVNI